MKEKEEIYWYEKKKYDTKNLTEEGWQKLEKMVALAVPEIKNHPKEKRREYIATLIRKGFIQVEPLENKE